MMTGVVSEPAARGTDAIEVVPSVRAPESELIARARDGNEEAFAALFDLHKRRVYSLCLRMTNDRAEAEDLTQEAFLQLFRKIATFRGDSAFSTWLHRLVVNVVLMRLRRKSFREMPLEETDHNREDGVKREYGSSDCRLEGTVDRLSLLRAIHKLPRGYRTVLVLHDIEGYEHSEIARLMNRSVGNCKSQLHKARLRMRQLLHLDRERNRPLASLSRVRSAGAV